VTHGWRRLNDLCATLHIVDCGRAAVVWNKDEWVFASIGSLPRVSASNHLLISES